MGSGFTVDNYDFTIAVEHYGLISTEHGIYRIADLMMLKFKCNLINKKITFAQIINIKKITNIF